jgi:hypothetical protein
VVELLNYLNLAFQDKRAYLKLINVPIIMYVAQQAKGMGVEPKEFAEKIDSFFMDVQSGKNDEYSIACQQGSAKKANVQTRLSNMSKILGDK